MRMAPKRGMVWSSPEQDADQNHQLTMPLRPTQQLDFCFHFDFHLHLVVILRFIAVSLCCRNFICCANEPSTNIQPFDVTLTHIAHHSRSFNTVDGCSIGDVWDGLGSDLSVDSLEITSKWLTKFRFGWILNCIFCFSTIKYGCLVQPRKRLDYQQYLAAPSLRLTVVDKSFD